MVIKSEAVCPKCNTEHGYYSPLEYNEESGRFYCKKNEKHVFKEGEDGFLHSV